MKRQYVKNFQGVLNESHETGTDLAVLQEQANEMLDTLRDMIEETLPFKGDTCQESQKVCLLEAINKVEKCLNGLEEEDLNTDEQEEDESEEESE